MDKVVKIRGWDIVDRALAYLADERKLSKATVNKHKKIWTRLKDFVEESAMEVNFDESDSLSNAINQYTLKHEPAIGDEHSFKLLKEYVASGKIREHKQSFDFSGAIGAKMCEYISQKEDENLKESSIDTYRHQLSRLLDFLKSIGVDSLDGLHKEHIVMYVRQLDTTFKSDAYLAVSFTKRFLKWLYENQYIKVNIGIKIPSGKFVQQPNLPSLYTEDEIETLLKSIDRGNPKGKRDYLCILLAARLALRSSDICNLKFSNLFWEENMIRLVQVKTGRQVELPLLPEIGNAIIDYLKYGRPHSESKHILLSCLPPYSEMKPPTVYAIVSSSFKSAGIDTSNRRHGAHSLRHSLASRMLDNQSAMPVISEVLGHSDTNSTMFYLRVDVASMKQCMLDTTQVPDKFYKQFIEWL